MNAINTAIASYGMSGKVFHVPLLICNPHFNLIAVLERSKKQFSETYPNIKAHTNYQNLLSDDNLELVIVNTPDHYHFDMAKQALLAGKHVVVEKPFVQKAWQGVELMELADKKGLQLSVFHNRRWDSDFLTVSKFLKNDSLGDLVEFELHYDRFRNFIQNSWKEDDAVGAGTLYNLGSHLIDQALCLFGLPMAITANVRALRKNAKVDDYFSICLHYKQMVVTLKASYLVREPGPRYTLHGTKGSFIKYGSDPQEESLKNGLLPSMPDYGFEDTSIYGSYTNEAGEKSTVISERGNYNTFYDLFYHAVRNNGVLPVKPSQALDVIRIIECSYLSNDLHKTISL